MFETDPIRGVLVLPFRISRVFGMAPSGSLGATFRQRNAKKFRNVVASLCPHLLTFLSTDISTKK